MRQHEMWFPDHGLYTGFALQAKIWVIANCGLYEMSHILRYLNLCPTNQSLKVRHLSRQTSDFTTVSLSAVNSSFVILKKTLTSSCANQEYNTNSELPRFMLERSVYER